MGIIVLLIIIGSGLILLNIRAVKKEKLSFKSSLRSADIDMDEVDIKLGEMRREFTETIAELQIEMEALKDALGKNNVTKLEADNKVDVIKNKEQRIDNKEEVTVNKEERIDNKEEVTKNKEERIDNKEEVIKNKDNNVINNKEKNYNKKKNEGKKDNTEYKTNNSKDKRDNLKDKKYNEDKYEHIEEKYENVKDKKENVKEQVTEKKQDNKVERNMDNNIDNENRSIKINEVSKLLESGLTVDEISQKLGVNKGEVLLIKELYLK